MLSCIQNLPSFQNLLSQINTTSNIPSLDLPRAARLPFLAALHLNYQKPLLLITDRADHALTILDELKFWAPDAQIYLFPEPPALFYEQGLWNSILRKERLQVLSLLAGYVIPGIKNTRLSPIIVASSRGLMTRTLPRRDFISASKLIRVGAKSQPEHLQEKWSSIGYEFADTVVEPCSYTRRGGILDIWPPSELNPVRLEFFGNVIDTIRSFNPGSQRTIQKLESVFITPGREILPGKAIENGIDELNIDEFHLPQIHPSPASLLDYLPPHSLVLPEDISLIRSVIEEIEEQAVRSRNEAVQSSFLPSDFPIPYLSWSELQDTLFGHTCIELGHGGENNKNTIGSYFSPGPRFGGRVKLVMDFVLDRIVNNDQIVIVSRQMKRLQELWQSHIGDMDLRTQPEFIEGTLSDGWVLQCGRKNQLFLLTDSEIFGWERPQPRIQSRHNLETPEEIYADLKPGDWVVHVDYGIGRFIGLVQRALDGVLREFLCVEYDSGDQLFVPIYQADRLSRYVGPDESPPNLTRLGTLEWSNEKSKVREAVRAVALELLELYARRQVAKGFAFSPDSTWQHELEASFPYVETEDQAIAIKEVKQDMESQKPMDRLLCGDVGYGKTEVALRAAFKAVNSGKQVAILVPTTVLAQQHYDTFRQRLSSYPVNVEMLSRFRTSREQDEILLRLALGEVDIVIGTHRLIQSDVEFKDLGLVIIDEEQRFGVAHKEHFKKLRAELDVLTLTATPIPRTLYMALTGVRDISMINTPPAERLPVVTHIGPYSPQLVKQAILRELERGGQVFFVHNRVHTIQGMERHLRALVPEARIGIAHGQMPEIELADVMHRFTNNEINVLLCTSIIESGLDIPNANTLIVDRGDTFGLAQLYQLRGRVGRGGQRAYAYFFRHPRKAPTAEGYERMEIISENTQLGAGYSIAMRDLEMRGAGEMLGMRQHGYIAAVGFHLYSRILAQAVRELRKQTKTMDFGAQVGQFQDIRSYVTVDLPLRIGIPIDYIEDQNVRLRIYRRIAGLESEAEVDALEEEFEDRFGKVPEETLNLLFQIRIRARAEQAGLSSITIESDQLVLRFAAQSEDAPLRMLPPLGMGERVGKNAYWLPIRGTETEWKRLLLDLIKAINDLRLV